MTKTFEEVPVATVEVIPTFDGNEIKFKPSSKLENYLIAEGEVELYLRTQHQPLPVVPEFVGEWYEEHKDDLESSIYRLCIEFNQKVVNTLKTKTKLENWFDYTENKPIETLIRMQEGYRVEKPQLFYLREKNTNYYLNKSRNNGHELVVNPYFDEDNEFTQEEIDSMETGSYELVPVEDGE